MSRRALVNCQRCNDPIRKDKMVDKHCKHCFKFNKMFKPFVRTDNR